MINESFDFEKQKTTDHEKKKANEKEEDF